MDDAQVTKAFRDWTIADANDDELLQILRHLCSKPVSEESIRHRELLRGITINYIRMASTLQRLEETLKRHETALKSLEADSRWIKRLTVALVFLTIVLIWYAFRLDAIVHLLSR